MWNKNSVKNPEEMSDFLAKYKPSKLIQEKWNFQTYIMTEERKTDSQRWSTKFTKPKGFKVFDSHAM